MFYLDENGTFSLAKSFIVVYGTYNTMVMP